MENIELTRPLHATQVELYTKDTKEWKVNPAAGLTWTRAPSCSLRSSRQTPWTFSGCTRASSHTFQRWCSERPPAFPTSKLKTEEKIQKRIGDIMVKGTEGKKSNYDAAVSVCRRANPVPDTQSISCIYRSRPLIGPEQPITNNRAETSSAYCSLCRFSALTKEGCAVFGRLTKLDGNEVGWRKWYYLYKMLYCLEERK